MEFDELHGGRDASGNVSGLLALLEDVMPSNPRADASPNHHRQEPWHATYARGQGEYDVPRMPDLPDHPSQQQHGNEGAWQISASPADRAQQHYLPHQPQLLPTRNGDENRRRPETATCHREQDDTAERRPSRSSGVPRKRQRTTEQVPACLIVKTTEDTP